MRLSGQRGSLKQRAFALGIAVCLAFPPQGNVQAAQMTAGEWPAAFFPADLREIKVPSNIGSLEEVHQGRDERLVILVQDAHSIPTAQRSIRNLIDFFQQTYGLDTVAVEGARAELDPQIFRSFPDREKLKGVFSQYLEAGELTGTTFAAVFNRQEAEYRAIEDWPLFEKGYSFYLSALDRAAEAGSVMAVLEKALEHQKEQLYSPGLLRVDRAVRDFRAHSANLIDVLETLASVKPPEPGSELALMLEENSRTEETRLPLELEVKSISEKIRKYFQSHPSSGGSPAVAEFNAKLQAFQTSRLTAEQFAVYLKDLAKEMKFPVKFSGDFQSRVKRQMKIEDIDGTRFFESFERYAASVKEELFRSDSERELETQTERLYLLQRLRSLELTREQWHQLKNYARRGQFSGPNHIFLEESDLERLMPEAALRRLLDVNLLFYENAELRDSVFAENLEKMLTSRAKSPFGAENKAVMLVSGGFHTEGVLKLLKDKGISYLLLMPKIEALPETVHYKDHMQGLVSWRDYLEPEPGGGVNTYNAFVRSTRDRLKQNDPVVVKEWRDQIIRDLSKKGKSAEAARYTRFMDETSQSAGGIEGAGGNLLQKVDSFVSGLKELEARGQLTEPNILRLLRPSGIAPELPTNALVNKLIAIPSSVHSELKAEEKNLGPLLNQGSKTAQALTAASEGKPRVLLPVRAEVKVEDETFARSELRSENDDGKLSAEESSKLLPYLAKAQQERMAGLDDSYVMYSDIYRVLQLAQEENRGYLRYALNHGDFIYQYAEYLAGLGYKLDPALRDDILTLKRIVDSVMAGENSEPDARAGLDRLSRERDFQVLNTAVHRLAEKLESAEGKPEARLTAFLSRYVRDELQAHGPLAASFAGYLIEEHLEKGHVLVYLGRGTEQMQQILEGSLADRLQAYRGQIFELLISTEMMNSLSRTEIFEYLRSLGAPLDKKIIFIDTGFAATIARPMAEIVNETGGDSEFCLYCYVKPTPGLIGKIKRQLSYFFPQARTLGIGFNEVSELFRVNEDAYLSAAHFFDDLLGKRVEKVWRLQDGVPVTEPTRTGKFYRISRDAVKDWIDRQPNTDARSELRSQEGDEAMQVYLNLIAWRVSSVLERGLLRPMTARAMIASGEIPVPEELSSALLPFGVDVRQLLFASSADAKLAPEAYEENDKGALVVIEDIQNPSFFTDASYYEDYEDYIRIKVRGLTQGSPYRSPVSVIAERDFSDVQLELEARGAEVLNERLENSGMVLLSTDKPFEVLEEESEYRDGPNILGFRQIGPEQIEAFFVPEEIYGRVVQLLPEALRSKVVPVSGKKDLREMDGHAPEGLTAPSWDEALAAFLKNYPWEGRSARNFMLHGTRFDTPSEIQNRVEKRSELRNVSDEDYAKVAQEAERIRLLVENHSAIRSEPPYTKGTGDIVKALAEARDLSAQRGDMGRIAAIVQEANSWYPQRVKATLQAIDDQTIKPSIKQQFAVFSREVQRILKRAEEAGGRSELRTDSEDSASSSRGLKALDVENQIFPIIDALSNHPDEFQHPSTEEEKAIWNFLQERLLLQQNLYGDSADLSAIAGLFLKPSAEGERLIESRYPGILSTESRDTLRLTGPVMTVRDLGFGMNRFAYTVTVNRGGAESVFYAKVDNRDIGKKRDSLKESSTYLEMKNQQLLEKKFAGIPADERPYAEQFMTVRVDIEHSESSPSAASKTSSRWVQYGHLVEGRDLEKVMKSLRPDRARDSVPVRILSFSLGEMAGKLFFQTSNQNSEGWFFGDMKAANVAQTLARRPVILNIDSELLLVPPEQFDKNLTPGAKPHAAFTARQELAQIPYKVILEPLGQEQIFLPAATGETSPELVSEAQIANLFLAGFLAPIKADADWAAKAEAATGMALTSAMRESIQSVWAQAVAIDEGTAENFETLDLAGLEEGGDWMRRRLDEAGGSAAARSELRDDSPVLADENVLSGLAQTAGENLIRFYREEDIAGLDLSVAQAVARGAAVNFEEFLDAMIRSVEDSLGSEAENYSRLILDAMRDIAAKVKEAGYSQKKGVFVLSPSAERSELDLTQVNAYKDAVRQASGFIDSLYYRFKDNTVLRAAVREAGIQHFQPVSAFSSIRAPEDVPALPLLTSNDEKQEARSTIPFMQIGIFYPDNFERGDSSAIEETFAVFMQFVFGYVAQNKLSRSDFEFLNQLQVIASESKTGEDAMDLYDRKYSAEGPLKARARVEFIKAALIQPLTEILGEAAPRLLGGLELGSPGILVGQIAESMKAYEAVRTSA